MRNLTHGWFAARSLSTRQTPKVWENGAGLAAIVGFW